MRSALLMPGLRRRGFSVIAIIAFATSMAQAKPTIIGQVDELTISQPDVGLVQNLAVGPLFAKSHFVAPLFKSQRVTSGEAAHLVVGDNSFGISTDVCFYTPAAETTATPEPMSMLLMGTGLLGAAAGIRYRRRKTLGKS